MENKANKRWLNLGRIASLFTCFYALQANAAHVYVSINLVADADSLKHESLDKAGFFQPAMQDPYHISIIDMELPEEDVANVSKYLEDQIEGILVKRIPESLSFFGDRVLMLNSSKKIFVVLENTKVAGAQVAGDSNAVYQTHTNPRLQTCIVKDKKASEAFTSFTTDLKGVLTGVQGILNGDEDGFTNPSKKKKAPTVSFVRSFPHVTIDKFPNTLTGHEASWRTDVLPAFLKDSKEAHCNGMLKFNVVGYFIRVTSENNGEETKSWLPAS